MNNKRSALIHISSQAIPPRCSGCDAILISRLLLKETHTKGHFQIKRTLKYK